MSKPTDGQREYVILLRHASLDDGPGRVLGLVRAMSPDDAVAVFYSARTLPSFEPSALGRETRVLAARVELVMNPRECERRSWQREIVDRCDGYLYSQEETSRKASTYLFDLIARRPI